MSALKNLIFSLGLIFCGEVYACSFSVDGRILDEISNFVYEKSKYCKGQMKIKIAKGNYILNKKIAIDGALISDSVSDLKIFSNGDVNISYSNVYASNSDSGLHDVFVGENKIYDLYVDNIRAINSRLPSKNDFYYMNSYEKDQYKKKNINLNHVENFNILLNKYKNHGVVYMMHGWETSIHDSVLSGDYIELDPAPRYDLLRWKGVQRFYIDGLEGGFDEDGEWLFDEVNKRIKYLSKIKSVEFKVPKSNAVIEIKNFTNIGIEVRGINFSDTGRINISDVYYPGDQAATKIPGAIVVDNSKNVIFDEINISNIYSNAIYIKNNSSKITISNSHIFNIGGGGIYVDNKSNNITIKNNKIENIGLVYEGAVAVFIGDSCCNRIANNNIINTGYSGISVGRVWGYGKSIANNNIVENNVLKNIGRGVLSDLGGIYFLGAGVGSIITGNKIDGVKSFDGYAWGGWGIYLDEGSSFIDVSFNEVKNTKSSPIHLHYGEANFVHKNTFFIGGDKSFYRKSKKDHKYGIIFHENLFIGSDVVTGNGSGRDEVLFK